MDFFRNFPFAEALFFVVGICCLVPGIFMGWDGLILAQGHASTTGEHVSSRVKSGTSQGGRFGEHNNTVTATTDVVKFQTNKGEWIEFETTVPDEYENGQMPIIYSPDSPTTACIEPCSSLETGGLLFGAGAFMMMVGAGLRLRRQRDDDDGSDSAYRPRTD